MHPSKHRTRVSSCTSTSTSAMMLPIRIRVQHIFLIALALTGPTTNRPTYNHSNGNNGNTFTSTMSMSMFTLANAETTPTPPTPPTPPTITTTPSPTVKASQQPSITKSTHPSLTPTISPTILQPQQIINLLPVSEPVTVKTITMTLTGLDPLSSSDITYFEEKTKGYIMHYYNTEATACDTCLQKRIDVKNVDIVVNDQDPPFGDEKSKRHRQLKRQLQSLRNVHIVDFEIGQVQVQEMNEKQPHNKRNAQGSTGSTGSTRTNSNKLTLTYSQTTSYQKISQNIEDPKLEDIVKEPFNNISKRIRYRDYIKTSTDDGSGNGNGDGETDVVPDAFKSLSLVSAPNIIVPDDNFFSIGVIAAIASGGLVLLVLFIFLICKCCKSRKGIDGSYAARNRGGYGDNPESPKKGGGRSGRGNGGSGDGQYANGQPPSQVIQLPVLNDATSTLEAPSHHGFFSSGGKSLVGYNNTPSVATMDPDYVGIYSGGNVDDPSIVSSVGGTIGSNTQKSKFSAMGSVLTPGMNAGAQSIYTEDEQSFEDHLRNRRQNVQREEYFDIFAPGGKLGVVIDTPNSGAPIVHNIKDTCPIADQLRVGDKLICVDDEDVRSMTAVKVSKLISQKSNNPTRKFTISRVIEDS